MSVATRSARQVLFRDFYDLIPLFASHSVRPIAGRCARHATVSTNSKRSISSTTGRRLRVEARSHNDDAVLLSRPAHERAQDYKLPVACPGCGALTQSVHPHEAGHYTLQRAAVKKYLNPSLQVQDIKQETAEDELVQDALANISPAMRAQLGLDNVERSRDHNLTNDEPALPICDRCHHLVHHHSGIPINHPSLDAIEATISESPHKYNHVYHVIDAADFPMSFIPALTKRLEFAWIRGRNRRAKTQHWSAGKSGQISFIVTRSDLLAPKKEQVDQLMPQMREILRDAIGKTGKDVRLGNVHLVSSKRGWWTRQVKTDIWERGGANWLVGKANVGKSNIFQVLYPKGTNETTPDFSGARQEARRKDIQATLAASEQEPLIDESGIGATNFQPADSVDAVEDTLPQNDFLDTSLLLPPPQQEVNFPVMPIISSLPGTTASPIRIPFGKGKGELIDLPGMERKTLDPYIKPEHQLDIVMKQRVIPERIIIKPGSSLILGGGLVRITPKTPDLIFMAHAFVPLDVHLTSTQKAVELQAGERDLHIPSIMLQEKKGCAKRAGVFKLDSDVTKKYSGPLTRRSDVGLQVARLPFVVWATDILIEGVGWIEIVAQVRKPRQQAWAQDHDRSTGDTEAKMVEPTLQERTDDAQWSPLGELVTSGSTESSDGLMWKPAMELVDERATQTANLKHDRHRDTNGRHPLDLTHEQLAMIMPEIEVFSPEGKFVGQRPSLSCWLLGGPTDRKATGRPRKSMKGVKKVEKRRRREAGGASF